MKLKVTEEKRHEQGNGRKFIQRGFTQMKKAAQQLLCAVVGLFLLLLFGGEHIHFNYNCN